MLLTIETVYFHQFLAHLGEMWTIIEIMIEFAVTFVMAGILG